MKSVGIVFYRKNPDVYEVVKDLISYFQGKDISVCLENETCHLVEKRVLGISEDEWSKRDISFLLSIGGDGTLLHASRLISSRVIPILAVNYGYLGFLTDYNDKEMKEAIESVLSGKIKYEDRIKIVGSVIRNGSPIWEASALNDIVLSNFAAARIVKISLKINESPITTFSADGLIISTPTGSTAYSLSCGGPIIHPEMDCFMVNPVCSHTLTNRPLIITSNNTLTLHSEKRDQKLLLTADGQFATEDIRYDDVIEIKKSPTGVRFIRNPNRNFYQILRSKLRWGGEK